MNPAPRARRLAPALVALAAWLSVSGRAPASEGESHLFTSKNGQQISAVLLDVSADRKLMTIRRDDGQQFQTEITSLSLDDQQFVKDWLKNRPVTANYRLEVEIRRKQGSARRQSVFSTMTLEDRSYEFEISVRNLARETIENATLEYLLVLDDQVTPVESAEQGLSYSLARREGENHHRLSASVPIPPLAFNRENVVTTKSVDVHRLLSSSGVFREDQLIGLRLRILAPDGSVIEEASSGGGAIDRPAWEELAALPPADGEEDGPDE